MKKILLSICALLAIAGKATAEDSFSVDNITLAQNGEADVVVRFSLDEGSTCSGYTFWLQVPEGLAFVTTEKNGKTNVIFTPGDCYDETPTLTPNIDEGYLKMGCLTANSDPINGPTGTLVTFRLKTDGTSTVGTVFTGTLTNGVISAEDGSVHSVADASFTITIGEPADTRVVIDEAATALPDAATGVDVRVKRTIKAGEWSTICLPFAMTEAQVKDVFGNDVQLLDFDDYEVLDGGNSINVRFNAISSIGANHPCVIKVTEPVSEFTVDGVDVDPEEEPMINKGTKRKPRAIIGNYVAGTLIENGCLFLSGNEFWYSVGKTKIKGLRAYFNFDDLLPEFEDNYAESRMHFVINSETDGISDVSLKASTDACYDLQGRKVVDGQQKRGIYVKQGKKMVVK